MSKNIIIVSGDSWGAGEMNKDQSIGHGGLNQYLTEHGYDVRNLSYPGGSNLEACKRLEHYLHLNKHIHNEIKFIIFWYTEFFREIWHYQRKNELQEELSFGYAQLRDRWVCRPCYVLTEIMQRWNIPIYIIGGASDAYLYEKFEEDFTGLKVVCQSTVNLLLNNNSNIDNPVYNTYMPGWVDEFLNLIKPGIATKDLEELTQDIDLGIQRLKALHSNPQYFYPDGIHPNRHAQKILFEFLLKNIPELLNE